MSAAAAPWRVLLGALETAETRAEDMLRPRMRAFRAHRAESLTPAETALREHTADAADRLLTAFLEAVAASPLAAQLPSIDAGPAAGAPARPAAVRRAQLRLVLPPLLTAAAALPVLAEARFAERVVVLVQTLTGWWAVLEHLNTLPLAPPPFVPRTVRTSPPNPVA